MHHLIEQFTENGIEKASPTPGQIVGYAGENIPDDWLPCDGRMLRRRVYPQLFSAIGTQYGDGDGSNTAFNLPDLVSEVHGVIYIIFVGTA